MKEKENIRLQFAKRLRELREKHGMTQEELSERADIAYKHIQRLESRHPTDARLETIVKIANAFKMTPSKLLDF
ncbi:MAG: helix-turn-helix transcriptional regulator [Candidatus Omnitrophica bacterium]|nr:helix-turn-helix transcriptional regulator [Candidatus Omnitrophota bacterium]